jgi:hypothetical protein
MAHGRRPLSLLVAMGSHRRCNAVRFVARTNPRRAQLMRKQGVSSAALDARRVRRGQPLPVRGRLEKRQQPSYLFGYVQASVAC